MSGILETNARLYTAIAEMLGLPKDCCKFQLTMNAGMAPLVEIEQIKIEATIPVLHTKIFEVTFIGEKPRMVIPPGGDTTAITDIAVRRAS